MVTDVIQTLLLACFWEKTEVQVFELGCPHLYPYFIQRNLANYQGMLDNFPHVNL